MARGRRQALAPRLVRSFGMIARLAQDALARTARGGGEPHAATSDPLLFRLAMRRIRRLVTQARRATSVEDPQHTARLAYLFGRRQIPEASFDDFAGIASAFERAAVGDGDRRKSGPWVTVAAACAAGVVALSCGVAAWRSRPFDPHRLPLGHALDVLADEIVATIHETPRIGKSGELVSSRVKTALGDDGAKTLEELRAAIREAGRAGEQDIAVARDRFYRSAGLVDAALARARQPFYVDAELVQKGGAAFPWPLVYSFYIERESEAMADQSFGLGQASTVRVVYLWRLDDLNVGYRYLGYTHPRASAALVLFDQIEEELVDFILPSLREGESFGLFDAKSDDPNADWQRALNARAGELVRAYFAREADKAGLVRIGELLARRRAVVRTWANELPLVGLQLHPPTRLVPEADYAKLLHNRVLKASLDEWDAIHDELLQPALLATFDRLRDRFARSTARHEVQHRLDFARGLVAPPALLTERLALENPLDLAPSGYAARCRDETSAYLAQMADPSDSPTLTLLLLSRFLFDQESWGSPYACAAQMVFELVMRELDLPDAKVSIVQGGRVLRQQLASRFTSLVAHEDGELRAASYRAWRTAYGATLPVVTTRETVRNTPWRH